jgi:hypothetical protein
MPIKCLNDEFKCPGIGSTGERVSSQKPVQQTDLPPELTSISSLSRDLPLPEVRRQKITSESRPRCNLDLPGTLRHRGGRDNLLGCSQNASSSRPCPIVRHGDSPGGVFCACMVMNQAGGSERTCSQCLCHLMHITTLAATRLSK